MTEFCLYLENKALGWDEVPVDKTQPDDTMSDHTEPTIIAAIETAIVKPGICHITVFEYPNFDIS
jgi:hypothetical protein